MEFQAWPKTPRLYRDVVITEKIDGTNAAIIVEEFAFGAHDDPDRPVPPAARLVFGEEVCEDGLPAKEFLIGAQSRNRLITPEDDNYGFAAWVRDNAQELAGLLGPGRHFGEWYGAGIQRGYGLSEKRFALFNVLKWADLDLPLVSAAPVLYRGPFSDDAVDCALADLSLGGSRAAPGFMNPEGVCVFHKAAGQVFKVLLENDELPKSVALRRAA